jgi:DNA-binding LytR/AlgR family response regulator
VDVVFLDIQMPDLTGIELVQQLSELPKSEKPAIVFITAYQELH